MPAPYDLINMTNPSQLFTYSNTVTDGMFGTVILGVFFVICFIAMKSYTTKRAFTAASFITALLSGLFFVLEIISPYVVFTFIIMTAVGIVALQLDRSGT